MKHIGILLLFGMFIFTLTCTNDEDVTTGLIRGVVTDSAGTGLDSVIINTIPSTSQVMTNDSGYYEIADVEPGVYNETARKTSYIPETDSVEVEAGQVSVVNFTLLQNRRNTLGEMLTTVCHCADEERAAAYSLKDSYGSRFVYLEYHTSSDPSIDTWDPFTNPGSDNRRFYYADTFIIGAWMFFDGTTMLIGSSSYHAVLDSLLTIASPLSMKITGTYSSNTKTGNVDVEITALDSIPYDDLKVQFVLYERGPIHFTPPSPPDTIYRNIVVSLLPAENLQIAEGESIIISRDFIVPDTIGGVLPPFHEVNADDIGLAVFVQSQGLKDVLQAVSHEF